MDVVHTVSRLLEGIGRNREAHYYLELFRAQSKENFAVVVVRPQLAEFALEAVAVDLRCLAALELKTVVVLGLEDPKDGAVHATRLMSLLTQTPTELVDGMCPENLRAALRNSKIAIATPKAPTYAARFSSLKLLINELQSPKLIVLQRAGGLVAQGEIIAVVNVHQGWQNLLDSVTAEQQGVLEMIREVVDSTSHRLVVSLTSPLDLLRDLFTVKGAGTLLRAGIPIVRHDSLRDVDRKQLSDLLEASFGSPVHDSFYDRELSQVFLAEGYRGAALLLDTHFGSYMTKFAVTPQAQGEGVGGDLWGNVVEANPRLFWRARSSNPVTAWYAEHCTGFIEEGGWKIYWRGIARSEIDAIVEYSLSRPVDFA